MPRNLNNITQTNGYSVVKPNIPLEWSSMYMAQTNQGTADCGKIIPVFWKELMPNQTVNIEQSVAIQFTPFVSNLFHQIRGELMSFFVPYRICAFMRIAETIDEDTEEEADQLKWQGYITGGKSGADNQQLPLMSLAKAKHANSGTLIGTLADYFGMPVHITSSETAEENAPNMLLWNAYNLIYNTKFRNPDYTKWKKMLHGNLESSMKEINEVATAYWNADRFTRARAAQYRGIAPSMPVSNELIELAIKLEASKIPYADEPLGGDRQAYQLKTMAANADVESLYWKNNSDGSINMAERGTDNSDGSPGDLGHWGDQTNIKATSSIPKGEINAAIDYNEFLYDLAVLKYYTNNARIKPLYVEQLKYRFGIIPQDSRFQEPEWIASNSFDIGIDINQATAGTTQISESGETLNYTQNDQGKITSQAWGSGRNLRSKYKALEHGVFMTLMIIRPEGVYEGGLDRHLWGDRTRLSFPTPELMNTPDQEIWTGELYWTGDKDDDKVGFGWEQVYDQDRTMTNQVCGLLRPSLPDGLKTYTLARYWNNENIPVLNDNFLLCEPDMDRIKQYTSQPDFIFFTRTEIKTALPMPIINEPVDIGM